MKRWREIYQHVLAELFALVQEFDTEVVAVTPIFAQDENQYPPLEVQYW